MLRRIGELLHLQFVYEREAAAPATTRAADAASLPKLLAAVPKDLIAQLQEAVIQARAKRIEQLATEVAGYSEEAAEQIRAHVRNFRYDSLAEDLRQRVDL